MKKEASQEIIDQFFVDRIRLGKAMFNALEVHLQKQKQQQEN